jgi:GNAT superfamily N-acetyltransferase
VIKIRSFAHTDRAELRTLFGPAGQDGPSASFWGHKESEAAIYLDPYMELEPETLFVAVADGALVGYLTGCRDSSKFPSESERVTRAIRRYRLVVRPGPMAFFARSVLDLAWARIGRGPTVKDFVDPRWPAHLHINVAPAARGTGAADRLMRRWLDWLGDTGSPGCYLQTLAENTRAVRFFERMGFAKHGPTPPVPGMRQGGKRLHQQTMVWTP